MIIGLGLIGGLGNEMRRLVWWKRLGFYYLLA